MKTDKQQAAAAAAFAERWKGRGYEKGDSQVFWTELLTEVFGVENPSTIIRYEEQVKVDNTNFIDGHIPSTKVLIEQKSIDKDLRKGIKQSDGSLLNPFQQAKRYAAELPDELTMPVELRRAHQDNDRAVMAAYGFPIKTMTESQCVAELFKLYQELTK